MFPFSSWGWARGYLEAASFPVLLPVGRIWARSTCHGSGEVRTQQSLAAGLKRFVILWSWKNGGWIFRTPGARILRVFGQRRTVDGIWLSTRVDLLDSWSPLQWTSVNSRFQPKFLWRVIWAQIYCKFPNSPKLDWLDLYHLYHYPKIKTWWSLLTCVPNMVSQDRRHITCLMVKTNWPTRRR